MLYTSKWTQCGIKIVNSRKEWCIKSNECYCDAMIQAFNNGNNNNNMVPSTHFLLHVIELRGLKYPNLQAYWIMGQKLAWK